LIDEILEKYPNNVNVEIKNFPLNFHKQAYKAAQYALAAHQQGKFQEMYHTIFLDYKKLKENPDWPLEIAQSLGLDMNQFVKDFNSDKIKSQINIEMEQLKNANFEKISVPKFAIYSSENQEIREITVNRTIEDFSKLINEELDLIN
tara:strand:- start:2020 stop:2460 length:441 start_codon:yes stop_codon:yes gene_type:complete